MTTAADNEQTEDLENASPQDADGMYPFPDLTSYVTIKLDPVASVASLEDGGSTLSAKNIVTGTYVGYVVEQDIPFEEEDQFQSFHINLLRAGFPKPVPDEYIEQDMCIPVFPNTQHPSREPIKPSKPLPWNDCYHASFERITLRVPPSYASDAMATNLPEASLTHHIQAVMEDQERRRNLREAAHPTPSRPMPEYPRPYSMPNDNPVAKTRESISSRGRTASIISDVNEDSAALADRPFPPPLAIMSYDLAALHVVGDPQDLFKEIKLLEQLHKDARERAPARKAREAEQTARAIAEAKKLDDVAFGRSFKRDSTTQDERGPTTEPRHAPPPHAESASNANTSPVRAFMMYFIRQPITAILGRLKIRLRPYACGICCSAGDTAQESEADGEANVPSTIVDQQPRASDALESPLDEKYPQDVPPVPIAV